MNSDRNKKKVAVVTGSSTGIGFETSLLLARNGFYTYSTMRNLDKSKAITNIKQKEKLSLEILQLDVTADKSVKEAINKITNEQERIDVLVNNAGFALVGAFEEISIEEFKEQYETNVFGVIRVTQAVLPIMRNQRGGTIVNISSIAGKIGFPLTSAYVSSKFALEGLTESMAYEIEQFGIKVILIEPGVIKTNFNNNLIIGKRVANNQNSSYTEMTQKRITGFQPRFESGTPPVDVAKVILKAITSENLSKLRYLVGNDAFKLIKIRNNISDKEFGKLVIKSVLQYQQ
ncbi:MAG TPA: SDR family oxidoreductase [Nitrososphaeraceae archaeon]|nr:SDR family oxidoreductase [Nitrososphaeraceae archaeon]